MNMPYVGISSITSRKDALALLSIMPMTSNRKLMIGPQVSLKTLRGASNRYPNRFPKISELQSIFPEHPMALNLIHYNTKEQSSIFEQLLNLTYLNIPNLHGFQLNVTWPLPSAIHLYHRYYPQMKLVLQIGKQAFEAVKHSPEALAKRVTEDYMGAVDYILLDPSGGLGVPFDTEVQRKYLEALAEKNLGIGLGVAGGLGPSTLHLAKPLINIYPELSIDAEGRLRNKSDMLDMTRAKKYLTKALKLFGN